MKIAATCINSILSLFDLLHIISLFYGPSLSFLQPNGLHKARRLFADALNALVSDDSLIY